MNFLAGAVWVCAIAAGIRLISEGDFWTGFFMIAMSWPWIFMAFGCVLEKPKKERS